MATTPNPEFVLGKKTDEASIAKAAGQMVEAYFEQRGTPLSDEMKAELAKRRQARLSSET